MLVIGREVGEVIVISDNIKVKVLSVEGGTVRFGISAPRHVEVHRIEVYKRIMAQLGKELRRA
ncbi:carbon storage regulator CsrA [Pseudomonas sp. X10]